MKTEPIQDFNNILETFNIKAQCVSYRQVDNYLYYDVRLNQNGKIKDLQKYGDEISLALKTACKPGIKVLRDQGIVRLEFAEPREKPLQLFDFFTNKDIPKGDINCLLGQTTDGNKMWMDLAQNPHMIIAGATGSGKSTLLHNIIANLLNYNDVDLTLIDPKRIEFTEYEKNVSSIQVLYTYEEAVEVFKNLIDVMEYRYELLRGGKPASELKPMVVIVDEFADLIMQDKDNLFYTALCRLAQKCRAARIHLILATQRPSVNIINGTIKANFPARIACRVTSHVDSKVILDSSGAENLLGKGDALIRDNTRFSERFQVAYTTAAEVCQYFGDHGSNQSI
jgi:S-DNA-T family DNA segregation ATPase FtsK/SpoIIIE